MTPKRATKSSSPLLRLLGNLLVEMLPPAEDAPERDLVRVVGPESPGEQRDDPPLAERAYPFEVARRIVRELDLRFADAARAGNTVRHVAAVRDGGLGLTTVFADIALVRPSEGASFQQLRRLLSYLSALHATHLSRYPELVRPDDYFFVGILDMDTAGADDHEIFEAEQRTREQLYRLVTTLQSTATLPSSLNLRFRFRHREAEAIERLEGARPEREESGDEVDTAGLSLLGQHLFGLRTLLPRFWRGSRSASKAPRVLEPISGIVRVGRRFWPGAQTRFHSGDRGAKPSEVSSAEQGGSSWPFPEDSVGELARRLREGRFVGLCRPKPYRQRLSQVNELVLHDLRCFERAGVALPLYPLTFVVGGNGSGKTAVAEALALGVAGRVWRRGGEHCDPVEGPSRPIRGGSGQGRAGQAWTGGASAESLVGVQTRYRLRTGRQDHPATLARVRCLVSAGSGESESDAGGGAAVPMPGPRFDTCFLDRDWLQRWASSMHEHTRPFLAALGGDVSEATLQKALGGNPKRFARAVMDALIRTSWVGSSSTPVADVFGELTRSMEGFGGSWNEGANVRMPAADGTWIFRMREPVQSGQTTLGMVDFGTATRATSVVATHVLCHALAWPHSSGVLVLDQPTKGSCAHGARATMATLTRLRRWLGRHGLAAVPARRSLSSVATTCRVEGNSQDNARRLGFALEREAIPPKGTARDSCPAQMIVTTSDRDLALEALEGEGVVVTSSLRAAVRSLLPGGCVQGGLRERLERAVGPEMAGAQVAECSRAWEELAPWTSPSDCSAARATPDHEVQTRAAKLEERLKRLGLRMAAAAAKDAVATVDEGAEGADEAYGRIACAVCAWLGQVGMLPAAVTQLPRGQDLARAGLFALPPPLRANSEEPTPLRSERGEMLLRVDSADELALARMLRALPGTRRQVEMDWGP